MAGKKQGNRGPKKRGRQPYPSVPPPRRYERPPEPTRGLSEYNAADVPALKTTVSCRVVSFCGNNRWKVELEKGGVAYLVDAPGLQVGVRPLAVVLRHGPTELVTQSRFEELASKAHCRPRRPAEPTPRKYDRSPTRPGVSPLPLLKGVAGLSLVDGHPPRKWAIRLLLHYCETLLTDSDEIADALRNLSTLFKQSGDDFFSHELEKIRRAVSGEA